MMTQKQLLLQKLPVEFLTREDIMAKDDLPKLQQMPKIPPDLFYEKKKWLLKELVSPKNYSRPSDEIFLYHGTDMNALTDMMENGISIYKNHGVLGTGLYVSPSAREALRWSRRGKPKVVLQLAVKKGSQATVCCVPRNHQFQRMCSTSCEVYTAYETVMMHKYKEGYLPYFWQYLIKDQKLFENGSIYIKKVFLVLDPKKQAQTGGAASV